MKHIQFLNTNMLDTARPNIRVTFSVNGGRTQMIIYQYHCQPNVFVELNMRIYMNQNDKD